MNVVRRALVAALLGFACACSPAASNGPDATIEALYQPYLADSHTPDWRLSLPMTPDLAALVDAEDSDRGEGVGAIETDPVVAAQDFELSNLVVSLDNPPANGAATVTARFNNFGAPTTVQFDMVGDDSAGWRVTNIRSGDSDLRAQLTATASPATVDLPPAN